MHDPKQFDQIVRAYMEHLVVEAGPPLPRVHRQRLIAWMAADPYFRQKLFRHLVREVDADAS